MTRALSAPLAALLAAVPVVAAAVLGNLATIPNIPVWHAGLIKPPLNPPNWIFGPVWTALYLLMAVAFYRILRAPQGPKRRAAILVFLAQMALNASWSFAFFAAHSPLLGLFVILPLEALIVATIARFASLDALAARLLWPYAAWVGFATYLNAAIWWLNG